MKKLLLFTGLIFIIACNTQKLAIKRVDKISHKYPEVIAEKCKASFNPTDSIYESIVYLPGDTEYIDTYVTVNCDSIVRYVKDTLYIKGVKTKCPPSSNRVDTVVKNKFVKEIDKASIFLLEKSKDSLTNIVVVQNTKIKSKNNWIITLSSILGLLALVFIIKKYKKTII